MQLLLFLAPPGIPRLQEVSLNGTVLGFTAALGLLTGLAFGLWPAWHAARAEVAEDLKESARGAGTARTGGRVRRTLVVAQVALSLVLLIGASLLISSLVRAQRVDPGFAPDHLLTMQLNLPPARYRPERSPQFIQQAVDGIAALPDIRAASATTTLPLGGNDWGKFFTIEGRPAPASLSQVPNVNYRQVTSGYFRSIQATLRRGRFLTDQDGPADPRVVVVNETLARRFWQNEDPVGQRVALLPPESLMNFAPRGGYASYWLTVVGVVANLRTIGLEAEPNPEIFAPLAQANGETLNAFFLVARTQTDPLANAKAVEAAIHNLDRNLPVASVQAMDTRLANSFARRRFSLFQLGLFAALALVLAMVGLYGVIAYAVSQRAQEMSIRAALGARKADLIRLVVGQGLLLAAIGVVVGLASAASLSSLITSQLFQVKAIDPLLYAAAAGLLFVMAILACWIPGRRAARIDPAIALRDT
jgi:putative ABC transport system permease protein